MLLMPVLYFIVMRVINESRVVLELSVLMERSRTETLFPVCLLCIVLC